MGRLQQPLLAEESKEDYPSLSGPSVEEEDSPLSRLIAESTPEESLLPYAPAKERMASDSASNHRRHSEASFTTLSSGTLIVLCWGFIWGAFFSNSWMDSHLRVTIGWQQKYLPWLDKHTDLVIQESSVFTLSADLDDDKEYFSLLGLWICSIILPCIFMIVCPIWVISDWQLSELPGKKGRGGEGQPPRLWLELSIRFSLLVVFILIFLNVAITGIELEWKDTHLEMHNQLRGPYISYLLGCTCAVLSVVVLRLPFLQHLNAKLQTGGTSSSSYGPIPAPAPYAPPAEAFRLRPWLSSNNNSSNDNVAGADASETEPILDSQPQQQQEGPDPNVQFQQQQQQQQQSSSRPASTSGMSLWQRVVLFQCGLLALILWFPVMALGQFRVLYDGLIVDLVKTKAFNVYLWQIPKIVWQSGIRAETPKWIMVAVFSLVFLLVLVLPLMAHFAAAMTCIRGGKSRAWWRDLLTLLHPTVCGIPFAIAIIVTVPSFIDIGENLDKDICHRIEDVVQNQCLITGGVRLAGSWFTLAQAVCLELFIALTLFLTESKKQQRYHEVV